MITKKALLAGAALALFVPSASAYAADLYNPPPETDYEPPAAERWWSPWYIALRGGATFAGDTTFDTLGGTVDGSTDTGPFVAGAIGYQFRNTGLRAEAEIGYLESSIDSLDIGGVTFENDAVDGDKTAFFGLASVYYDIPFNAPLRPFIGGGIGVADVSLENVGPAGGALIDDNANAFAWHLTAGATYDINDRLALEAGYRYMAFEGVDLIAADGTETSVDTDDHIVFAGLKYRF